MANYTQNTNKCNNITSKLVSGKADKNMEESTKSLKVIFLLVSFHFIMINMVRIKVLVCWYVFLCVANITSQYYAYAFCVS